MNRTDRSGLADFFDNTGANIYSDGTDDGFKFLTSGEWVEKNKNDEYALKEGSYLLPDASTFSKINSNILSRIHGGQLVEHAGFYFGTNANNGSSDYLHAGQSIMRNGVPDVGPALAEKYPSLRMLSNFNNEFVYYIHSHPFVLNYGQVPTYPQDYRAVDQLGLSGGIMTTNKNWFYYNGLDSQFGKNEIMIETKILKSIIGVSK